MTVQGITIPVASGSSLAAIDTGTSLIGGPSAVVKAIYKAIPGSHTFQNMEGFYSFRTSLRSNFNFSGVLMTLAACMTTVSITLAFGGKPWPINPVDLSIAQLPNGDCVGAIFDLSGGSVIPAGTPSWVVGDAFLKNVYSVFRESPPSVGFAALSALAKAGGSGPWCVVSSPWWF